MPMQLNVGDHVTAVTHPDFTFTSFPTTALGKGGGIRWQSPNYDQAANRYDVSLRGGASNITIDAS